MGDDRTSTFKDCGLNLKRPVRRWFCSNGKANSSGSFRRNQTVKRPLLNVVIWVGSGHIGRNRVEGHSREYLHGQSRPWRRTMGHSQFDPAMQNRPAWNAGKMVGAKRPLTQKQIWAVRFFLDREARIRDRALFDLALDSKLRGCDLVKIRIGDVVSGAEIRTRSIVIQQKTGRPVQFELTADVRASLLTWLERRGGTVDDYAFPSRVDRTGHLSTRQYARLVDEWVTAIGLRRAEYGTHSLRRTKAAMIYRATGNIRAIQILLGHTKIENTVRYLGVDIEDALILAERTEI
jgi:integrase